MILRTLLATAFAGAVLAASPALVAAVSTGAEAQCRMINIGTPEKPRWVKDPGCGSGR